MTLSLRTINLKMLCISIKYTTLSITALSNKSRHAKCCISHFLMAMLSAITPSGVMPNVVKPSVAASIYRIAPWYLHLMVESHLREATFAWATIVRSRPERACYLSPSPSILPTPSPCSLWGQMALLATYPDNLTFAQGSPSLLPFPLA
jgi:hypothetical protein